MNISKYWNLLRQFAWLSWASVKTIIKKTLVPTRKQFLKERSMVSQVKSNVIWKKYLQVKVSVVRRRERQSFESPIVGSVQHSPWGSFGEYSDETEAYTSSWAFYTKGVPKGGSVGITFRTVSVQSIRTCGRTKFHNAFLYFDYQAW